MLVICLTHVSHTRQLSSDNSGQPAALVSTLTLMTLHYLTALKAPLAHTNQRVALVTEMPT
jgi:hypothetical protein